MKVHVHDDVHQASENLKLRFWRAANRCQFLTFQLAVKGDVDLTQNEMPEWTWKRRRPRSAKLQQCQTIKVSVREWKKFCTTCRKLATSIIQTDSVSIQKILQVTSISLFPKQVYLWGSILEKKRLDTLVGALCYVGRGFGCAGRAGLVWAWGLGWVGRRFGFLCMARWDGLGVGFGRAGRAGRLGVGFGSGGRAGLGWARIWLLVYGLHRTCLLHVFMVSLCLCSCESQMCIMGLEQNKAWHWWMKGGFEHFRVPKVKRTKWKQKERNGSSGDQHSLKRTA